MTLRFELIKTYEGCYHFQELQRRVWGGGDDDLVPVHVLVTIAKNGGALLGAYSDDGPAETSGMVGAALWWLGTVQEKGATQPRFKACSHMAGVLPTWQGKGVGAALKLKQREVVLAQGITDWITWTYDPLYRTNGVFNIHRLGATCNTYYRNVYGEMTDDLNRGAPSDRCQVDWQLRSERVERAVAGETSGNQAQPGWGNDLYILPTAPSGAKFQKPVEIELRLSGAPLAVPIPDDIGAIRRADPPLGIAWRHYLRGVLESAFAAGYMMMDCVRVDQGWYYILTQQNPLHS